jgi:hypothetical protein
MVHKPSCRVLNVKRTLQLVTATAFLAGTDQVNRLHPLMKRNLAALKYGAYGGRELLAAGFALVDAWAMRFPVQRVMTSYDAAVRAYRAFGPADSLKIFARFFCVLEVGLVYQ